MRFRVLGGEALRNLQSGTSRAGLLALVVVLLSLTLISFDLLSIQSLQSRARDVRQQAGSVRVLVSKGAVNPTACSDLARLNAVDNAGAIWELGSIKMSALPRVEVPLFAVSPGVAGMLDFPDIRSGGVYIPEELSERWQATRGSVLESLSGSIAVEGVYKYSEQDGRDPRLANAIVVVRDSNENASECWFSVWPPSKDPDQYTLGVVASSGNDEASLQIAPLNPTVGQQFDFAREYASRVAAISAPAVVIVFGLVALSGMMRRRMETAGSLHAGAHYRDLVAIVLVESFLWSLAAGVTIFATSRLLVRLLLVEPLAGYETSLLVTCLAGVVAAMLCSALPVLLTREERLFVMFKSRN